ncbi:MAG: protease inhibitor I42 family protein [Elusimicrobia bacterium]|nr:protease inhibitor I42 family protein [Elusimicrobiota bacterium]
MKKLIAAMFIAISAGTFALAQETGNGAKIAAPNLPAYFDESAAGKVFAVPVDGTIEIRLAENPATGYMWSADKPDTRIFQIVSDEFVAAKGVRVFKLKCLRMGSAVLKFAYTRPWEENVNPAKTFHMKFEVVQF